MTLALLSLTLLGACSGDAADSGAAATDSGSPAAIAYEDRGAFIPAHRTVVVEDPSRERTLTVEVWYPLAEDEDAGTSVGPLDLIADGEERAAYAALLDAAPDGCPTEGFDAFQDGGTDPDATWPLLVMSHCHECTRFSMASAAEHLASHGFVVAAPDHDGNTLFDQLDGTGMGLDTETLAMRVADLGTTLDAALADDFFLGVDPARVGAIGHSFGAVTAGKLSQDRQGTTGAPAAVMMVGAPAENPLLPGVDVATIDLPQAYLLLEEDHSIGGAGNTLIESNFAEAPGEAWLLRMADGGHWSPSDLVGLTEGFMPGCGEDERMDGGEPFSYLPPADGRRLSGAVAAAFFSRTLGIDPAAGDWLSGVAAVDAHLSAESR